MMRALQSTVRSSLQSLASASHIFQHRAASAALQQQAMQEKVWQQSAHTAAGPLGLSCSVTHQLGVTDTLTCPALTDPRVQKRQSLSSHSQPATMRTAAMASVTRQQPNDEEGAASAAEQDAQSGKRASSLWQQLRAAGSRGVKRNLETSSNSGQHRAQLSGKQVAAQRVKQHSQHAAGTGPHRQAQVGPKGATDLGQGAQVLYRPGIFTGAEAARLLRALQDEVAWQQKEVTVHGKTVMQPRLVAYIGDDPSLAYTYSRQTMLPEGWTPAVSAIKARLEQEAGAVFNTCLLNQYRHGKDHMSWHSDNEALYGPQPVIGSVSFGEARDFVLRQNDDHSHKLTFPLGNGDMLTMQGTTQDHWMHAVPKRAKCLGPRINLTFRRIVHPERVSEGRKLATSSSK